MNTSSDILAETTRKSLSLAFQGLSEPGIGAALAKAFQTSDATISREKNDHLEMIVRMICFVGLKIVPATDRTINEDRLRAIALLAHHSLGTVEDFTNAILEDKQ